MTKYFESYNDARLFIKNAGLSSKPFKKTVWFAYAHQDVWAVEVK